MIAIIVIFIRFTRVLGVPQDEKFGDAQEKSSGKKVKKIEMFMNNTWRLFDGLHNQYHPNSPRMQGKTINHKSPYVAQIHKNSLTVSVWASFFEEGFDGDLDYESCMRKGHIRSI